LAKIRNFIKFGEDLIWRVTIFLILAGIYFGGSQKGLHHQ